MNKYIATVIRTGNSYALRVPKSYVDNYELILGQKIVVGNPLPNIQSQDREAIKLAIRNLQKVHAYSDIKDPVAWQREIRKDRDFSSRD